MKYSKIRKKQLIRGAIKISESLSALLCLIDSSIECAAG